MHVLDIHERVLQASERDAGALIDGLGSERDRLWPSDRWPAMRLDGPLAVGTAGGHGTMRYVVEVYEPGRRVRFRFTAPAGFGGIHQFAVEPVAEDRVRLRHVTAMWLTGSARLSWPLLHRPLHDALIEDALDRAERSLGLEPKPRHWSPLVRLLRSILVALPGGAGPALPGGPDRRERG